MRPTRPRANADADIAADCESRSGEARIGPIAPNQQVERVILVCGFDLLPAESSLPVTYQDQHLRQSPANSRIEILGRNLFSLIPDVSFL